VEKSGVIPYLMDKFDAFFSNYCVRLWKWTLQKAYHFDKWHVVSLRQRKYAKDIIGYCNHRNERNAFAEIGCGLGDIIRNVSYAKRNGYDSDPRVLKAAAFLAHLSGGNSIDFSAFHFPEAKLSGTFDVILMVNWIHHIEPSILKSGLEEYFNGHLNREGVIIIDTVKDPGYRFNHDILGLTKDLSASVNKLGEYERQREIWAILK
jgi:2-polyprenyl-3-methyl-5-hydroxy-6-metoxy-1,4-benzoquinol methylase